MASLKVFISSTCYDLNIVRAELRDFLFDLGHDPIMSDYNEVLFDPRLHTHESCLQEVNNADVVVLIIGQRHGGIAIPRVVSSVDLENMKSLSNGNKMLDTPESMSITQLEILKAIESNIPVFTFIDSKVSYNHLFYEKNKNKGILDTLEFPGIEKKDHAIYIFEFINYLRLRSKNNSIIEFNKLSDIQEYLRKQWSSLLQRLLYEQRNKQEEEKRLNFLSKQIEDIKTAILTTIPNDELKDTAKGAIRYRGIIEFFFDFKTTNPNAILLKKLTWDQLLDEFGVKEVKEVLDSNRKFSRRSGLAFIKKAGIGFYFARYLSEEAMNKHIIVDWNEFKEIPQNRKNAILNAIKDSFVEDRYKQVIDVSIPLEEWLQKKEDKE